MSQSKKPIFFAHWLSRSAFTLVALHAQSTIAAPAEMSINQEARAQRAFGLQHYLTDLRRLERISYRLLIASAPYCQDRQAATFGSPPVTAADLPAEYRRAFAEASQSIADKAPRFHHVISGSPTAQAGLQEGDSLVSVNMADMKEQTLDRYGWTIERSAQSMTLPTKNTIQLTTRRGGQIRTAEINSAVLCKLSPRLKKDSAPLAQISGESIFLSLGLLRELTEEDEVALVFAHQIARWLLQAKTKESEDLEKMADYLSAYLLQNAGYSLANAKNTWLKLAESAAARQTGSIAMHSPPTPQRALDFKAVELEIQAQQAAGKRVLPAQNRLPAALEISRLTPIQLAAIETKNNQTLSLVEQDPRLYDLSAIPFIDAQGLAGYRRFLESHLRPRAFVIGYNPETRRNAWNFWFGPNAAADALQQCELRLRAAHCYLYALDEQVVWNTSNGQHTPNRLSKAALLATPAGMPEASGYASISDVRAAPINADESANYMAFLDKPAPRAFVVLGDGTGKYWVGSSALESALDFCEQSSQPCWLYALNDRVVWQKDVSKRISKRSQLPSRAAEQDFLLN